MQITIQMLLLICIFIFIGGFIDSIAGGGGLISLPAYIAAGLPAHFALGTNKFSSSFGTLISTIRFIKSKKIHYKSALTSAAAALLGSFAGAETALMIDQKYLKYLLLILLPAIAVFILTRRGFGEKDRTINLSDKKIILLSVLSGLLIGAYDGFFGPGTGTFLILMYTAVIGFDMTTASGNAKVVNLASNISAVVTFLASGKVMLAIGIPAAISGILGNWFGSGLAIKKGAGVIKPVFMGVLILLMCKIVYDLIINNI